MDRRQFVKTITSSLLIPAMAAVSSEAWSKDFWAEPRSLWLQRAQTGEAKRITYFQDGQYHVPGYIEACQMLRDTHENKAVQMDPVVLDILRGVYGYFLKAGYDLPIIVTSGFRTARTNQRLAREGAAKNSMHLYGKAVDFYVPNVSPELIARLGYYFKQGGVGVYTKKGFTHLDTGSLRVWRG